METTYGFDAHMLGIGLLIARLALGTLMAAHGAQKLFGWFGGYGLNTTGEFFVQLGFRQGRTFALAASIGEITSGLLVAFGFLGPVGPAIMISVMIVAAVSVHWKNGLFATTNGVELPLLYAAGAAGLALAGPGRYSLDAFLGLPSPWPTAITLGAIAVGILGGLGNLALRRMPPAAPSV
jgi:putative oxidoreductase